MLATFSVYSAWSTDQPDSIPSEERAREACILVEVGNIDTAHTYYYIRRIECRVGKRVLLSNDAPGGAINRS